MIPRIKQIFALDNYLLRVLFDDGRQVLYDVKDDIKSIPAFRDLKEQTGLFHNFQLDPSRTCVYWSDQIDLASDSIAEYGIAC